MEKLAKKKMNLFFLNFSYKNFKMVSDSNPKSIPFLVLSVDAIWKDGRLKVIMEHERGNEHSL